MGDSCTIEKAPCNISIALTHECHWLDVKKHRRFQMGASKKRWPYHLQHPISLSQHILRKHYIQVMLCKVEILTMAFPYF